MRTLQARASAGARAHALLALVLVAGAPLIRGAQDAREAQQAGDYKRAAGEYEALLASDPRNPKLLSNLGVMLHLSGQHAKAVETFRQALTIEPGLVAANLFGGLSLVELGRAKEALPWLERAYKADPAGPLPALAMARAEVSLRNYRKANDYYDAAAQRDPRNAEAWFGLGITYRNLLDATAARIGQIDPEATLGGNEVPASRPAVIALERNAAAAASDVNALARLAKAYEALALEALTRAVQLEPDSERAHLLLAESYGSRGDLVNAIPEYEKAIRVRPSSVAGHLGLATTYWKSGDLERALPPLREALRLAPADPEANGIMADILVRQGHYEQARPHADRGLRGNPNLLKVRYALGKIYASEGKDAAAVEELKKALPADPDGSYYYTLAQSLKRLGRDEEARAALEQFRVRRARARR